MSVSANNFGAYRAGIQRIDRQHFVLTIPQQWDGRIPPIFRWENQVFPTKILSIQKISTQPPGPSRGNLVSWYNLMGSGLRYSDPELALTRVALVEVQRTLPEDLQEFSLYFSNYDPEAFALYGRTDNHP